MLCFLESSQFLTNFFSFCMDALYAVFINIVPFLVVLTVLVFFHELGHYVVARWNGVRVEEFAIGFGPEIFGWNSKKTGTRWKVCYIPLGGYVNLASEDEVEGTDESRHDPGSMMSKSPYQRIAISIAGPVANFLLAMVFFFGLYVSVGQKIPLNEIEFGQVVAESAADIAGLESGDVLIGIEGVDELTIPSFQEKVSNSVDQPLAFTIRRGESEQMVMVTPQAHDPESEKPLGRIGVAIAPVATYVVHGPLNAAYHAVVDTYKISVQTLSYLGQMIVGTRSADGLSGVIGIANVAGKVAEQGIEALIWLAAMLSISLGLINLFPIPMLDGGHIVFYIIEIIRGKPLPEKALDIAYRIGFGIVAFLILFSTWQDLTRLKIVQWFTSLFGF